MKLLEGQRLLPMHLPVPAEDFMPSWSCGGCEHCDPPPTICAACSYDWEGKPVQMVYWPCEVHLDRHPKLQRAIRQAERYAESWFRTGDKKITKAFNNFLAQPGFCSQDRNVLRDAFDICLTTLVIGVLRERT